MTSFLRIILVASLIAAPILPALATGANAPPTNNETPPPSGGCDWSQLKESLGFTESGGRYHITNPWNYLGKYQFGEARLADIGWWHDPQIVDGGQCMNNGVRNSAQCETRCGPVQNGYAACYNEFSGNWTGEAYSVYNIRSYSDFLANGPAQERAFDLHAAKLYQETKGCHNAIGRTITDRKGRTCQVSMSGIIAGGHLAGAGGVCRYLNSGGGSADNATHVSDYICTHKNLPVPIDGGQCAADNGDGRSPPDPGSQPNTDPEFIGAGGGAPPVEHYEMAGDLILRVWLGGLALMTNQMVNTMMMQAEIVGTFFDAKHQLETQRLLQQKTARAHKDYHPSEQMCTIGTFSRNLMNTNRRAEFSQIALAERGMQRELQRGENLTVGTMVSDLHSRFETYRTRFCNPSDNLGTLAGICEQNIKPDMMNRDIDFTRTLDLPLTLAFDPLTSDASDEEAAIYALMDNLFQHKPISAIRKEKTTLPEAEDVMMELRSIVAMRALARDSMNHYIAQKAYGPEQDAGSNAAFIRALIRDMGITDEREITRILGERPSYYAQMEVLTKTIYQHPQFITNLYDKPANVERLSAALQAIKTMQNRDIQSALQRREMLISLIAELSVRRQQQHIDSLVRSLRN